MSRNTDPWAPWNDPVHKTDPFAPHNDPTRRDGPFEPWNKVWGSEEELSAEDRDYYRRGRW